MPRLFRRTAALLLVAAVFGATLGACQRTSPPPPPQVRATPDAWAMLVDEYLEAYFRAHPHFAASVGRHEFDGQLPDWSAAGIHAEIDRLKKFRQRVTDFPDSRLDAQQRFERDYLLTRIDRDIFWTDVAEAPFRNPEFYLGMDEAGDSLDPSPYVMHPYGTLEQRAKAFIRYARSVAAVAPEIRRNLRTPMPATYLKLGIAGFGGLADFYRSDVPKVFADIGDEALKAELRAAIEPAAKAMDDLAQWLKGEQSRATGPDRLGPERYAQMLKMTQRIDMPLSDLESAARADLERNQAALKAACAEFAPGATLAACVVRMGSHKPEGSPVDAARAQLEVLRQFVVDKDIVTIPGSEQAKVAEAPPFNRQNFAYIDPIGPYDKGLPSVYYIAPPDPAWPQAEQDAYVPGRAILLFTSAHEVWPGHFLQFMWSNRAHSKLGSLFVDYAFTEGWAHYAEEMMWERGLGGDPETHIGQLVEALLRDARFLASMGLHVHEMTIPQAEQLFREQAFADPGTARQQAARGTYDPAYLNYTLGKLMIRKLRADYCAGRGQACWKDFHDHFLSYGGPPIPLIRAAMLPGDHGALL